VNTTRTSSTAGQGIEVAVARWAGRGLVAASAASALVAVMLVDAEPSAAHQQAEAAAEVVAWARSNAATAVDPTDATAPEPQAEPAPEPSGADPAPVWGVGTISPGRGGRVIGEAVSVEFSGYSLTAPVDVTLAPLDQATATTAVHGRSAVLLAPGFDVRGLDPDGERVTSFPNDAPDVPEPAAVTPRSGMPVTRADDGSVLVGGFPVGRAPHPDAANQDTELDESMAGDEGESVAGVRVEVGVDPDVLVGISAGSVRLVTRETDADPWTVVPSYLDAGRSVVVGELDHLSQFVVIGGKDTGDPRPRVVLDPDNDRAFADSPGPRVTEVGYNVELANQVAARLTQTCNADVVVTRTTPIPELGREVRAGMASAHEPDLTVTFGFNGNTGTAWGNIGNGGSEVYSRGGALDEQARASVLDVLPVYTGRPANPKSRANLTYREYAGLPGALVHLEALFLDHNFDRPVIDNGFGSIVDGVLTALGLQLENQGFDCSDPDRGGGWPSPPSAAQIASWMQLGFKNYAAYGGDPVNIATGNLVELEDLFEVSGPGGSDTQIALVYNSQDGRVTRFGTGWTSDLTARAQRFADGSVMVVRGDGASFAFAPDGVGGYATDPNTGASLAEAGGGHLLLTVDDGATWRFDASHPEGAGDVVEHVDATGAVTRYEYAGLDGDPLFRPLTAVVLPGEQRITVTNDARGIVTGLTAPDGRVWQLGYDAELDLRSITLPDGRVRGFDYDDAHRLTTARDAAGAVYLTNTYDDDGRVVVQGDGVGGTRTFAYRAGAVDYTDAAGSLWRYEVDARSRVVSVTDPLGQVTRTEYGAMDAPTAVIDADGTRTDYTLDAQGRPTAIDAPGAGLSDLELDDRGRVTQVTEPGTADGTTWTTTVGRDTAGRPTSVRYPDGAVEVTEYDAAGNPVVFVDAAGEQWTATFDTRGNQTSSTDPLGRTTTFGYDAGNRLTTRTLPSGATWSSVHDAAGRLVSETDPNGAVTAYGYDANDNLTSITDPMGAATRQVWDTGRRLTQVTDPSGAITRYAYNDEDVLVSETDPTGAVTTYTLDAAHRVVAVTDPNDGVWERTLDRTGNVVAQTDPAGGVRTWEYDGAGRLIAETDPDGVATAYSYAGNGRLIETRDSTGAATRFAYDPAGRVVTETGPGGRTAYAYDPVGQLVATTDPAGSTTEVAFDAAGQVTALTDRTGATTRVDYDVDGNPVGSVDADGVREVWTLDAAGRVLAAGVDGGTAWEYTYDPAGRVTAETDALGSTTGYSYDPAGQLVEATDPTGAVTAFAYDAAGRQTAGTDAEGVVTAYGYDRAGQLTRVVQNATGSGERSEDENVTTTYAYTPAGNLAQITGPTGAGTAYEYTPGGRLVAETDPLDNTWTYTYDDAGRLAGEVDPDSRTVAYAYDDASRVQAVEYSQPRATPTSRARATRTDTVRIELEYDATGNAIAMTDPTGATGWTYDAEGRRTAQRTTAGTLTTRYTPAGRQTNQTTPDGITQTWAYDIAGRVAEQATPAGVMAYTYDPAGHVTAIARTNIDTTNGPLSLFAYDPAGRTTRVRHQVTEVEPDVVPEPGDVALTCDTCLPGADYLAGRTLPGAGTTGSGVWDIQIDQTYTPTGHVATRTRADAGGQVLAGAYTYDALGRLTGGIETDQHPGLDAAQDFTPVGGPDDTAAESPVTRLAYTYDATGNRTRATVTTPDGITRTRAAVFDAADRLTRTAETTATSPSLGGASVLMELLNSAGSGTVSEYRYDDAGNRTRQATAVSGGGPLSAGASVREYAYGPDGRLAQVTDPDRTVAFTRDGLGRTATTTTTTEFVSHTTTATWDGLSQVAASDDTFGSTAYSRDVTGSLAAQTSTRTTTPAGGGTGNHDPTDLPGGVSTGAVWELTDTLGSVIAQAAGDTLTHVASYDPWGVADTTATAGWDADHGYTSQISEGQGSVLFYARTYDPGTGTFTTRDAWPGLLTVPGTLNAYGYVLADPLTTVDMLGYWPDWNAVGGWIADHKREIAGVAAGIAVGIAVGACIAATAGICGGVAAGLAATAGSGGLAGLVGVAGIGTISGAAGGAASYAVTGDGGQYSWSGAARVTGAGALLGGASGGVGYGVTAALRTMGSRITATHTLVQRANRPTFIADSRGTVIPTSRVRLESGYQRAGLPTQATRSSGTEYRLPDGSTVRVMSASGSNAKRAVFQNRNGQPVNPFTGKPVPGITGISKADNRRHIRGLTHVQLAV
jgi:RHS repeat-associated protein